ncbi:hypothetical protein ACHAXA_010719 [Cyclostephanos tholiformis]|uniref:Sulfotransferase n=1 Tax=Cyclostephanos tholiformis TaxID=382380 RepID=A0ABD3RA10_9STRA
MTPSNNDRDEDEPSCLRARGDTVPKYMRGPNYLTLPVINLGMPKMGSTSLQYFFGCAGYGSSHFWCGGKVCAECIRDSVMDGLMPFERCGGGPVYTQIDGHWRGTMHHYFPQVELLDALANSYDNATFVLTFRDAGDWYRSLTNWKPNTNRRSLAERMVRANVTGLAVDGGDREGGGPRDFEDFLCRHVTRVREVVPRDRLE